MSSVGKFAFLALILMGFFTGYVLGKKSNRPPEAVQVEAEIEKVETSKILQVTEKEFSEYQNLKDQKAKYDKANEIMSKVMLLFLADLGLQANRKTVPQDFFKPEKVPGSDSNSEGQASIGNQPVAAPALTRSQILAANPALPVQATVAATASFANNGHLPQMVTKQQARGAVYALYQAVLWREPDEGGGNSATNKFESSGWDAYLRNVKSMADSPEFHESVQPVHPLPELINRLYAVFLGRCPTQQEQRFSVRMANSDRWPRAASAVVDKARQNNVTQVFSGGFPPFTCQVK